MGQPKFDTCMWDLIDSNVELFMYLVKGVRFGTCRPNVSVFVFFSNSMYFIPESILLNIQGTYAVIRRRRRK